MLKPSPSTAEVEILSVALFESDQRALGEPHSSFVGWAGQTVITQNIYRARALDQLNLCHAFLVSKDEARARMSKHQELANA